MGNFFSKRTNSRDDDARKSKTTAVTDADRAVLELKTQRDQVTLQKRRLQLQIPKDSEIAREFVAADRKNLALLALRKKKHHQHLLDECENHLLKLQEMIASVEQAQVQEMVVEALERGNKAMREIRNELSVDYVEQIVQESEEARGHVEEINRILFGMGISDDDEEILADYHRLVIEEETKETAAAAKKTAAANISHLHLLPSPPSTPLPKIDAAIVATTTPEPKRRVENKIPTAIEVE